MSRLFPSGAVGYQQIAAGNYPAGGELFSIFLRIKAASAFTTNARFVSTREGAGTAGWDIKGLTGGGLRLGTGFATSGIYDTPALAAGHWLNVLFVIDGATAGNAPTCWINGVKQVLTSAQAASGAAVVATNAFVIGNRISGANPALAAFSELAFWRGRKLTDAEARKITLMGPGTVRRGRSALYELDDVGGAVCRNQDNPRAPMIAGVDTGIVNANRAPRWQTTRIATTPYVPFAPGTGATVAVLDFTQQPTHESSGTAISPAITVRATLADGITTDTAFTGAVTIAKQSGTGTLSGMLVVNAVSGVATFSSVVITGSGAHQLSASASGFTTIFSSSFTVDVAAAVITVQPSNVDALAAISASPVVTLTTNGTTTDTAFSGAVVATIASGTGSILSGGTVNAVAGIATFPGLKVVGTGNLTLAFTAAGYTPATSSAFAVNQLVVRTTTSVGSTSSFNWKLFVPADYDPAVAKPLIIALGGSGSWDNLNNNTSQLTDGIGPTVTGSLATFPAFVALLQPGASGTLLNDGLILLPPRARAQILAEVNIDVRRTSLTGVSGGGWGAYECFYNDPGIWSAMLIGSSAVNAVRINNGHSGYLVPNPGSTPTVLTAAAAVAARQPLIPVWHWEDTGDVNPQVGWAEANDTATSFHANAGNNYVFVSVSGTSHVLNYQIMYADTTTVRDGVAGPIAWLISRRLLITAQSTLRV
jgi:hypothetical protein